MLPESVRNYAAVDYYAIQNSDGNLLVDARQVHLWTSLAELSGYMKICRRDAEREGWRIVRVKFSLDVQEVKNAEDEEPRGAEGGTARAAEASVF